MLRELRPIPDLPVSAVEDLRALNNAYAAETSFLSGPEWQHMVDAAKWALALPPDGAFVLALDQGADYDSPNFLWFKARLDHFVYVDRIVVADARRGEGWGRRLYADIFARAHDAGYPVVACEVNLDPPNPGSLAFHERMGFASVGEQSLSEGKRVRYFVKALPAHDPA